MAEIKSRFNKKSKTTEHCPHNDRGFCERLSKPCNHTEMFYESCNTFKGNNGLKKFLK